MQTNTSGDPAHNRTWSYQVFSEEDKKKVKAKIDSIDFSAYTRRLPSSFVTIYGSCVGRDFNRTNDTRVHQRSTS